jgi:hypothetical protein
MGPISLNEYRNYVLANPDFATGGESLQRNWNDVSYMLQYEDEGLNPLQHFGIFAGE